MAAQKGGRGNEEASPATIAHALKGIDFPKDKEEIIEYAREHQQEGDPDVVSVLERIPDREYNSMADVERGVGRAE